MLRETDLSYCHIHLSQRGVVPDISPSMYKFYGPPRLCLWPLLSVIPLEATFIAIKTHRLESVGEGEAVKKLGLW